MCTFKLHSSHLLRVFERNLEEKVKAGNRRNGNQWDLHIWISNPNIQYIKNKNFKKFYDELLALLPRPILSWKPTFVGKCRVMPELNPQSMSNTVSLVEPPSVID